MVKTVFLVRRSPAMTHDEYVEHYAEHHAPLTVRHLKGLNKYVVSVIEPDESDPDRPDVIVEMTWDSMDDFLDIKFDSEEGQRLMNEDMAKSMGSSEVFMVEELVFKHDGGATELYAPGRPIDSLGGKVLPGAGWD